MCSFWNTSNTSLEKSGSKIIQGRLLIEEFGTSFKLQKRQKLGSWFHDAYTQI